MSLFAIGISEAISQEDKVRAKIGILIQSGDRVMPAKSKDILKVGDLIRIYVHPEISSYIYVVHNDQKTVSLLNMVEQRIHSSTLVLPSIQEFYQVDGKSPIESFSIICSQTELTELSGLFNSDIPYGRWVEIEREMIKKSKIVLDQKLEKPFAFSSNVRRPVKEDQFINKLKIFSGKSLLIKRYKFRVKE